VITIAHGGTTNPDLTLAQFAVLVIPTALHDLSGYRTIRKIRSDRLPSTLPRQLEVLGIARHEFRSLPCAWGLENHRNVVCLPVAINPR